jgi:hypothetical protein
MPGLLARVRTRLHLGGSVANPRSHGVVLSPETLDRIVPGKTSREEVLRLCGKEVEEEERRDQPDRRVLIYRGWRAVPVTRRRMKWIATVEAWEVFVQEARIEIERDVVKDVQVLIRRSRGPKPEPPA